MAAPIPSGAFLQVTDLGGASYGGGPHNITSGKTLTCMVDGEVVEIGPYLIENLKKAAVGADQITFALTLEPVWNVVAGNYDWNSIDVGEAKWFLLAKKNGTTSPIAFNYRPDSGAKAEANPQITVHIPQIPNSPPLPGAPSTPQEYTIEILGSYYLFDDGTDTYTVGTALA